MSVNGVVFDPDDNGQAIVYGDGAIWVRRLS